jgi:peroxiredoxin
MHLQHGPNDPAKDFRNALADEPAPSLKLKSEDGKVVALDSFRGKPVLLISGLSGAAPAYQPA